MWEKILAQLVAKHPGVSKSVLGLLAKKLADKVTEESQIEGVITDYETNSPISIKEYADLLQSESDKRVTEALKKKSDIPNPPNPPQPGGDPNDVNVIVSKAVAEALKPFQEMAGMMQNNNRLASLKTQLKAKGVDESWAEDVVFNSDYNEAQTVARLETKWNNTIQSGINKQVAEGKIQLGNVVTEEEGIQAIKDYGANKGFTKEAGYNIQEV